jgi:hypothetical protein
MPGLVPKLAKTRNQRFLPTREKYMEGLALYIGGYGNGTEYRV